MNNMLLQDIEKTKAKLIKRVKRDGFIYEGFGQKECRGLIDNYPHNLKEICDLELWCMDYEG